MAKNVAHVNAIIDLAVKGTKQAQKQLEQIGEIKDKIEKDGRFQYVVEVDDQQMMKLKEVKDKLDLRNENLMQIGIDEKSFSGSKEAVQEFVSWIKTTLESVRIGDIIGSGGTGDSTVQNEINAQKKKLGELQKILGEQKKIYEEQSKVIEDANKKINSAKKDNNERYLKNVADKYKKYLKLMDSDASEEQEENAKFNLKEAFKFFVTNASGIGDFEKLKKKMPSKNPSEKEFDFEDLLDSLGIWLNKDDKSIKREEVKNIGKSKEVFEKLKNIFTKEGYDGDDKEFETIEGYQQIVESALKAQKEASIKIKQLESQIDSLQVNIKKLEENARKSIANGRAQSSKGGSGKSGVDVSEEVKEEIEKCGTAKVNVKPSNLDGFYKEIEDYKTANIKVTLDNSAITKKNKNANIDTLNITTKLDATKSLSTLRTDIQNAINPIEIILDDKNIGNLGSIVDKVKNEISTDNVFHNQIDSLVEGLKGKYKTEENILSQIRGIINTAKDSKGGKLTQDQKSQLVALSKIYEDKTGKNFSSVLKEIGIRQNAKYLDGVKKDIDEYQNYLKEQAVTVPVDLELNKTSLEKLENQVKNSLSNVEITLDISKAKKSVNELKAEWKAVESKKEVVKKDDSVKTKDDSNVTVKKSVMPIQDQYKKNLKAEIEKHIKQNAKTDELDLYKKIGEMLKDASDSGKELNRMQAAELVALDTVYQKRANKDSAVQDIVKLQKLDSDKLLSNYEALNKLWSKAPNKNLLKAIEPSGEAKKKEKENPKKPEEPKKVPVEIVINNEDKIVSTLKTKVNEINPIDLEFNLTNLEKLKTDVQNIFDNVDISINAAAGQSVSDKKTPTTIKTSSKTVGAATKAEQGLYKTFDTIWSEYAIKTEYDVYDKIAAIFRGTLKKKDPQLSSKDAAKVASLKELYKLMSGKSSPVADILKGLGIKDFDTVLKKNYSTAESAFEKWSVERSPKKDKTANSGISQKPKESKGGNNVETTVAFKPDKKSLGTLKTNIQKSINPVDLTFTSNIKNIKADIMSTIGNIDINVDPKLSSGGSSSIGHIVKQIAEADSLMKDKGSTRFERSLFFNTKTGYISNPFVHGKRSRIQRDLLDAQKNTITESVNAHLHTHPSGGTLPSAGDISVWADTIRTGVTQQFIATLKEVLHFNFDNIKPGDLYNIADSYSKKLDEVRRIDGNYEIKNKDVLNTFAILKDRNPKQLQENFATILKSKNVINSKDSNGLINSFYSNFINSLNNTFLKNKEGIFNIDEFLDSNLEKIFPDKNLLSKNKTSLRSALKEYTTSLLGNVKKPMDENEIKGMHDYLRTLFKNKGYDPNEVIKTYSIDEFEKKFGTQIKETGQSSEIGQLNLLKGAVEDVETAVESKTDSFITEEETVGRVVDDEIGHLGRLIEKLKEVQDNAHISLTTYEENPHILTDPRGDEVVAYRGIDGRAYGGLVSNRYHGGTFLTDSLDLAKRYARSDGKVEKVKLAMKNPFEFDGKGSQWNELEYIGHGADEVSKKAIQLKKQSNVLEKEIEETKAAMESFNKTNTKLISELTEEEFENQRNLYKRWEDAKKQKEDIDAQLNEIYADESNPYGIYDTNKMVEYAKSLGHDGVIFKNIYDGLDVPNNLFVTFKEEQIHYIETIKKTFADALKEFIYHYGNVIADISEYRKSGGSDPERYWAFKDKDFNQKINDQISEYFDIASGDSTNVNDLEKFFDEHPMFKQIRKYDNPERFFTDPEGLKHAIIGAYSTSSSVFDDIQKKFNTTAMSVEEYEAEQAKLKPIIEDKPKGEDIPIDVTLNPDVKNLRTQLSTVTPPLVVKVDLDPNVEKLKSDLKSVKGLVASAIVTSADSAIDGETAETKSSITTLTESIGGIGDAFVKQTTRIGNTSKTQIKHINKVKEAVEELNREFSSSESNEFIKAVDLAAELEEIRKERKELKKQQEEFNKQKEESGTKETDSKEEKKSSKKDKKKDDSAAKQKAKKTAKDIVDSYNDAINDLDLDDKGNPNNLILDKVVDGKDTTLKAKLDQLKESGNALKAEIETGGLSDEALKEKVQSLKDVVTQIENLNVAENQIVAAGGKKVGTLTFDESLFNTDKREIEQNIREQLASQYEKILSDPKYNQLKNNPKKGTVTAKVLDEGKIKKVTFTLEEYGKVAGKTAVQVRELINVEGDYIGEGGKWAKGFKAKLSNLTQYVTGIELVMGAWRKVREGFEFVKELNTNMTTIYQTMDITAAGLDELSTKSIRTAKELGAVSTQMLDSVNIYAAYGKTVDEIIGQATPTVMLANAAQSSAEEASNQIQAVVQQYRELEGQEERIVNAYEKIAANVQIDFDKGIQSIAEGVQVAGTVANESGLSFEQFAASVAKVAERTRMEGSSIGNAYKTIMARVSRSKSAEDDADPKARGDAAKALANIGINVYDTNGAYQDFSVTLDQLAEKWDTLTDAQKANISEAMSGVRNINTMNAIIGTWTEAQQLAADTTEDSTYYLEVQEKHMESMQAKLNTLTATVQEFWYNLIDTGAVNLLIDVLTKLVQLAELVVNTFKDVGSVFGETGSSIGGIAGMAAIVATAASAWDSFNKKLTDPTDGSTKRAGFGGIFKDLFKTFDNTEKKAANLGKAVKDAMGTAAANGTSKLSAGLGAVVGELGAAKTALLGFGAAVAVIGTGIALFDLFTDSTEETKEAVDKLSQSYSQNQNKLKSYKETTDSIAKDFETLSKGVNTDTGENISLTADEYARYQEVCNQIAEMYPSVVKSYDAQGNAILTLKGNMKELNDEYDKYRWNTAKENLGAGNENLDTYIENFKNLNGQRTGGTKAWDVFSTDMGGYAEIGGRVTAGEVVDALEEIQNMTYEEVQAWMKDNENSSIYSWLSDPENLGLTIGGTRKAYDASGNYYEYDITGTTKEQWVRMQKEIVPLINKTNSDVLEATNNLRNGLQAYLVDLEFTKFEGVDDSVFKQVSSMISLMSNDLLTKLSATDGALETYIENLVSGLSNSASAQLSLDNILNLGDDASIEEVRKALEEDLVTLAKELDIDEEDLPELKVQLGLDDEEKLLDKYDSTVDSMSKKLVKGLKASAKQAKQLENKVEDAGDEANLLKNYSQKIRDYIKEQGINTKDELVLLSECVETTGTWAEAIRKFELNHIATDFEEIIEMLEGNLSAVESDINNINEAIDGSNSSIGLSAEQIENVAAAFEGLDGYNYDKLFESTASGVRLNAYELERLNNEYEKSQKQKYSKTLDDMQKEYEELCVAITEAADDQEELNLIAKRNNLKEQIEKVQELTSRYGGLTSAYEKWQEAQGTADSYEMYDNIFSGFENIDELYQRDLTGSDDFKNYMQQFYYGDLDEYLNNAGKSYQQFYEENAAMIQRYFTEDNTGSINFLNKLQELGYAWKNELGQWEIDESVEKIAKSFGWATSTVDAQFKKLEAHEFKFQFVETEPLDELKGKAKEVADFIKQKFGKEFDFNTENIDTVDGYISTLEELKGQSGRTAEEIAALNAQIEYWTARKGELTKGVEFEFSLDATIAELELCQDKLKKLGKISEDFNLNPASADELEVEISKIKTLLESFRTSGGQIDITQDGAEETLAILFNLLKTKTELDNPVVMTVDTSKITGETAAVIQAIQEYQDALNNLETIENANADLNLNIDTTKAESDVAAALAKLQTVDKDILAKLKIDPSNKDSLKDEIKAITPEMMIKAGVDKTAITGYDPEDKEATVTYDIARTKEYDAFLNKNLDRNATVTYTYVATNSIPTVAARSANVKERVDGTAHVSGTAYANGNTGDWGLKQDETALVGELGSELSVDPSTGRWNLLGKDGAEFRKLKKGTIIFNHKQTEELFKNGYVTSNGGRGKAFINGTISKLNSLFKVGSGNAYAPGTLLGSDPGRYTTSGSDISNNASLNNNIAKANKSLNNASDAADEFLETLDWVEIMIDRLERKIQDLDTIANSAYKNFSKRNKTLAEEFGKVAEEITLQQQAYNVYMAKANSIALSEAYKQKVRDGKLQIEDITDENLKEKIDEFQEWYEKALDCKYAITDLNEQLGDLAKTKFDNVQTEFDEIIAKIEDSIEMVEGGLDIVEAKGQFASRQYFETLMSIEKENIAMIEKEYADLQGAYNEAMSTGAISEGSEAWYEMQQQIRDVEKSLQDANLALIEYKNDMWDMDWSAFEYGMELIEQLTSESEFLVNLLSLNENDLFSKVSGKLTDSGFSVAGLHAMDYNVYMAQAEEYEKKMKEVNAELAKDPTNKILIDKKNEYLEAQREAISNANDEKMAIRDLIEESYNRMLEILQELIDKRKEALQAEKDLYSYEKNVAEQTKQIADYQKQLSALAGDDSEESKSKRQQLQESLRQAESDLEETEYDQWLSDQEKLMDKMYEDYETILNERLDNIDGLLMDMINHTNENADMINTTITSAADKVGYGLTEDMTSIWNTTDSGIGKVVSDFNTNFTTTLTTTNEYIKKVYNLINKNVKNADKDMTANTKPGADIKPSSTGSSSSSGSTSKPTTNTNTSGAGQNKGWFFVYKKDSFPKNQLNTERSIVDRLKYHNFDSSWSNMAMYYEKMGLGSRSSYVGSYQQNVNMLNWMKKNGFRHSGQLSSMISTAREDGLFLGRKDDTILAKEDWLIASAMVEKLIDFSRLQPNTGAIKGMTYTDSSENNFTMNFNLPNISNGQEFVDFLKTKKAQNIIQSYTTDAALGKNSLSKYKYK